MSDLLAARSQMAISLAFHIIFAIVGIGMPALMVIAERQWQKTGDSVYLDLAKRWAKGTAIMFAVGAVSGTVLSFELGLLWPRFMQSAGSIIGMPFSLEGFAFFTEAIFLGVYLYGWNRIGPRMHLAAGVLVALSGALSAIFVVDANAWMNTPTGFRLEHGQMVDVHPFVAMANPAALAETLHMTLAAYASLGMAVAGLHAFLLLRQPTDGFHKRALIVALMVGAPAAVLQPISGDIAGRVVADTQPVKLAAMEGEFRTQARAPLRIGGIPDVRAHETRWDIEIPGGLSFMAYHDFNATVKGLDDFPEDRWPPVVIVHLAFQVMVGLGTLLAVIGLWALWDLIRRHDFGKRLLIALSIGAPLGFICVEAGWTVTEVGRQPWIVAGILRTADAVTPMPGLVVPFLTFTVLYVFLGVIVTWLMYNQVLHTVD
ncbi:MAG TPA: cytochrome ubiquinol oxidase subunit I [Gemmatimonadaceae bacterium]|jgi:cytochrome d ubiquinol oxidase subunit I|nr:cytochrome ubiquinol oxidase subunit I [Gemmatimonadaceae bacterium]